MANEEEYVIMGEVLRKMSMHENYRPTDYEQKVVASLLEQEIKYSPRRSKKELRIIQQNFHDSLKSSDSQLINEA